MFPKKLTRQPVCNMDEPVVETANGRLSGRLVEGTYIFRGIKYADAARFHMPEKVKPWSGVREAVVYGAVCCEECTTVPADEALIPHYFYPQDENCQYLNIWTQHINDGEKRPVMVWLHGGAFSTGSSCEQLAYDGENLSRFGDVVVVSLNHRLNLLGFLNLSAYGEQYRHTGNLGIADIVTALEWVRDNIAAFGGDPGNVTLFGQSGGGGKITTLLQAPAADGLYHKAILISGVISGMGDVTVESSQKLADAMLGELGISQRNISMIERLPYYKLARAAEKASDKLGGMGLLWGPVCDGDYYMGHPLYAGFRKETGHISLMLGSVLGEFTHNYNVILAEGSKNGWNAALTQSLMKKRYGDEAGAVQAAFHKAYPWKNAADALFTDKLMRRGNIDYARLRAESGSAPVYSYIFCLDGPINGGTVPWHGADLPYIFHNADHIPASYILGVSDWMQDMLSGACVAFAGAGDPNHTGMPVWSAVQPGCDATMVFDGEITMRYDHDAELMALLPIVTPQAVAGNRARAPLGGGPRQSL